MGINIELARKAEKRAREICREIGQPEALWQMVLSQAYDDILPPIPVPARPPNDSEEAE